MTVQEIYKIWCQQCEREEIHSYCKYRFPEIAYTIRESQRSWNTTDINVFISYLKQNDKKWFVANLFAIQENIPERLFEPFIDAAINEPCPSFNNDYIAPCLRVFGFERVFELLNQRFKNGSNKIKVGVCRAYYWARSPICQVCKINEPWETKGYLTKWNGHHYVNYYVKDNVDFEMSETEVVKCLKLTNQLLVIRRRILIEEFLRNQNIDVRYHIKLTLPKDLSSYSNENKDLAKTYFKELKKNFTPDNYSDLMFTKRLGILGNSKLIRFLLNIKNKLNRKKGLITLKSR